MPPFSPALKGFFPNSKKLFCPEKPCQPSLLTHGGSMRPVELGVLAGLGPSCNFCPVQSALLQYTAPGKCRLPGRGRSSYVRAIIWPTFEDPHLAFPVLGFAHVGEPSAGPPES